MTAQPTVVRIAHAYGNNRPSLARALAADCEMIEVDMWYRDGELYIHHERRLDPLPILYDRVMKGHPPGPYAIRVGDYFARPDVKTIRLDELLDTVAGKRRLLLDVKGRYHTPRLNEYVETLVRKVRAHKAEDWVAICSQTFSVLNALRRAAPDFEIRYSIQHEYQWESFLRKMSRDPEERRVCIEYGFITPEKARIMVENNVDVYCWTVDDWEAAKGLVLSGVHGITSNDLEMLATMPEWVNA